MKIKDLPIKKKIYLYIVITLLVIIGLSFTSISSLIKSQKTTNHIINNESTYLRLAEDCKIYVLQMRRFEKDFFFLQFN